LPWFRFVGKELQKGRVDEDMPARQRERVDFVRFDELEGNRERDIGAVRESRLLPLYGKALA